MLSHLSPPPPDPMRSHLGTISSPSPSPPPPAAAAHALRRVSEWSIGARPLALLQQIQQRRDTQQHATAAAATTTKHATGGTLDVPRSTAGPNSSALPAPAAPPFPCSTLFGRYRLVLLLECGPSLLATLQPGSARILSAMLGTTCRKVLTKIAHAATKFHLSIGVTIVCACVGATPSALPSFTVLVNNWLLGSVDPTSAQAAAAEAHEHGRDAETTASSGDETGKKSAPGAAPAAYTRRSRSHERPATARASSSRRRSHRRRADSASSSRASSAERSPPHSSTESGQDDGGADPLHHPAGAWDGAAPAASSHVPHHHHSSSASLAALFDQLAYGLDDVENAWIEARQARARVLREERRRRQQGRAPSAAANALLKADAMAAPVDVRQLLLSGLFALSRMDNTACPLLLLFTDGIMSIPPCPLQQDPILNTLLQQHITLHVCQLNGTPHHADSSAVTSMLAPIAPGGPNSSFISMPLHTEPCSFGYVPDFDLLRFLCWSTGGVIHDVDALAHAPGEALLDADPFAPASFRPSKQRASTGSKSKRHAKRGGSRDARMQSMDFGSGFANTAPTAAADSDEEEAAFLRSTRSLAPSSSSLRPSLGPLGPSASPAAVPAAAAAVPPSPLHPDDSGFEFSSWGVEGEEEPELEQIDDEDEDQDDEASQEENTSEEENTRDRNRADSDFSDDADNPRPAAVVPALAKDKLSVPSRVKQLVWDDTATSNLSSSPSPSPSTREVDPMSLSTHSLASSTLSASQILTAASNTDQSAAAFFALDGFVQKLLLQHNGFTRNDTLVAAGSSSGAALPEWLLPRYRCSQQWQKVPAAEGKRMQLRKLVLSEQTQSERIPLHLLPAPKPADPFAFLCLPSLDSVSVPELVSTLVQTYRLSGFSLSLLVAARIKEGFHAAHFTVQPAVCTSSDPAQQPPPPPRCTLTWRLEWKPGVHVEYAMEWSASDAHSETHTSISAALPSILVTVWLVATTDFLRSFLRVSDTAVSRVPALPGATVVPTTTTAIATDRTDVESLEAWLGCIQTSDLMLLQLQRAQLTPAERSMLDDAVTMGSAEAAQHIQGSWLLRLSRTFPPLRAQLHLSVLPPSSYLSGAHPLWRKLSTAPWSVLRRWLTVDESSMDVVCSVHRTYEVNQGADSHSNSGSSSAMPQASLTASRRSSDSNGSGGEIGAQSASEKGVGTFVISWMELELELSMQQQQTIAEDTKPKSPVLAKENSVSAVPQPSASPNQRAPTTSIDGQMQLSKEDEDDPDATVDNKPASTEESPPVVAPPLVPTPALAASFLSDSSASFSSRLTQRSVMSALAALLTLCASICLSERQWIIFVPPSWLGPSAAPSSSASSAASAPPPFILLRLRWATPFLASLDVATFGLVTSSRQALLLRLRETLVNSYLLHQQQTTQQMESKLPKESGANSVNPTPGSSPIEATQSTTAQLHMYVPGTAGAPPSLPLTHQWSAKPVMTKLYPFGITWRPLAKVLLSPHAVAPASQPVTVTSSSEPGAAATVTVAPYSTAAASANRSRPYMLSRSCHWKLSTGGTMATALALLRKARMEEGFVVVHSSVGAGTSTTYAREIPIQQQKDHHADGDDATATTHCMLQYCVHQVDAMELETDVWMESSSGFFAVPAEACTRTFIAVIEGQGKPQRKHDSSAASSASRWLSNDELFEELCTWLHACDLHLLSIVATFDTVRDLEFSPGTAGQLSYLQQPALQRGRSLDSQTSGGGTGSGSSDSSKLGLELSLDLDFHADLSFSFRFDARRRARLCRARLAQAASELEKQSKAQADSVRLAQVEQSIQRMTPMMTGSRTGGGVPPPISLQARDSSATLQSQGRPPSHPSMASTTSFFGSDTSLSSPYLNSDFDRLYSQLLSPGATPSSSQVNLSTLGGMAGGGLSTSPSPMLSPSGSGSGSHWRTRSSMVGGSSTAVLSSFPPSPMGSPSGSGRHLAGHGSTASLGGHARSMTDFHGSGRAYSRNSSKKDLHGASGLSVHTRPSTHQEQFARQHGALVPLSLTYLLDCSASTPLYFPVPGLESSNNIPSSDSKDAATMGSQQPFVTAGVSSAGPSKPSVPTRSTSMPEQINAAMKEASASPLSAVSSGLADGGASAMSLLRLQGMLISAVRRLSDLELIADRVFAQLVNEYTIIFLLLPGLHTRKRMVQTGRRIARKHRQQQRKASPAPQSSASDDDDDDDEDDDDEQDQEDDVRDDVDWYLDCLLAARGYSPIELSHLWQQSRTNPAVTPTPNSVRLPELCAVLFECNRDEFGHPRTFPFPPPTSLPTFGSLPPVLPPAHALLPLFPPPGPANVSLALLSDGRPHLLPHTYLFLQGRLARHTIRAWRLSQQNSSATIGRKVAGMVRQNSLQRLVRARGHTEENSIPLQRHRKVLEQQLLHVDALRYLFSTPPLSCVARQLPQLPHAPASHNLSGLTRQTSDEYSTRPTPRKNSRVSSDGTALIPLTAPFLVPLTVDGSNNIMLNDAALVTALPASASSPMFAAAAHLLTYHSRILGAHMRNFVRGVYLCLVEGQQVRRADVMRALRGCAAYAAEVDLSMVQTPDWKQELLDAASTPVSQPAHFLHGPHAHARRRSGSNLMIPPGLPLNTVNADGAPAPELLQPSAVVLLDPSHPLSRPSIVGRVRTRFEQLLSVHFVPVENNVDGSEDGTMLYFHRPPVRAVAAAPTSSILSSLNPRPLAGMGTLLPNNPAGAGTRNNLVPPSSFGSGGNLPPLPSMKPALTKSVSVSSAAAPANLGMLPRSISNMAQQGMPSGAPLAAAGGVTIGPTPHGSVLNPFLFPTMHPQNNRNRSGVQQSLAPEHSTPFFLQLECLVYALGGNAGVPDRFSTPSLAGYSTSPHDSPLRSTRTLSRPSSPAISATRPPLAPRGDSPSHSPAHTRAPSFSFASQVAGSSNVSTAVPLQSTRSASIHKPAQLSRQQSVQRPFIIPISLQTSIADVLADMIAQRVSAVQSAHHARMASSASPNSFNAPSSSLHHNSPGPLGTSMQPAVSAEQMHASLHSATSIRTVLRLKCITLRTNGQRVMTPLEPTDGFDSSVSGFAREDESASARLGASPFGVDDETNEEERFYGSGNGGGSSMLQRRDSMQPLASPAPSHSTDYESEHGTAQTVGETTTANPAAVPSSLFPVLMAQSERLFALSSLPRYLRQVMESVARSLELLIAEEVLHTLLTIQPVHVETIHMVKKQCALLVAPDTSAEHNQVERDAAEGAQKKAAPAELQFLPFTSAPRPPLSANSSVTMLSIPLKFVPAEHERARALFPSMLAHACGPRTVSAAAPSASRAPNPDLIFFPPPAAAHLNARCVVINHRQLYYMVDLLPEQAEIFSTLQQGSNMLVINDEMPAPAHGAGGVGGGRHSRRSSATNLRPPTPASVRRDRSRSNSLDGSAEAHAAVHAAAAAPLRPLPFWFLFECTPDGTALQLTFHHALLSTPQVQFVLEQFHRSISSIVHRVNQICLLNLLHATRVCSALLIPNPKEGGDAPNHGPQPSAPSHASAHAAPSAAAPLFHPGDLACPKVLSVVLTLHDRLHPSVALRNLGPMALHPFVVNNRRNVFVYQEKTGSVYYLKISTIEAQASASHQTTTQAGTAQTSASVSRRHSGGEEMAAHMHGLSSGGGGHHTHHPSMSSAMTPMSPPMGGHASPHHNANTSHAASNALLLDIYGLAEPGEEITVQLHSLLQAKLSAFTLSLLSQMLTRNPLFKLTPADHRFIRAVDSAPAKAVAFPLLSHLQVEQRVMDTAAGLSRVAPPQPHPAASALVLRDPYLFVLYLRQNMDRFFSPLCLSYTVDRDRDRSEREAQQRERRDLAWGVVASQEVTEIDMFDFIEAQKSTPAAIAEEEARQAREAARALMSPMAELAGAGEPVDLKASELYFLFNNYYSNASTAMQTEVGKGLSTVYLSLAAPSGHMPMKHLNTHAHAPWNAQSRADLQLWRALGAQMQQLEATPTVRTVASDSAPSSAGVPSLPPISALDLKPRVGGFSSVFDHVAAGCSGAEHEDDRAQLFDYMDSQARATAVAANAPFWLVAEVWSQGNVNHDALLTRVHTIVNQSMHEYWMETLMYAYRVNSQAIQPIPQLMSEPVSASRSAPIAPAPQSSPPPPAGVNSLLRSFDQDLVRPMTCLLPSLLSLSTPLSGPSCVSQRMAWSFPQAQPALDQLLPHLAKLITSLQPAMLEEIVAYRKTKTRDRSADSRTDPAATTVTYNFVPLEEPKNEQPAPSSSSMSFSQLGAQTFVLVAGFGVRSDEGSVEATAPAPTPSPRHPQSMQTPTAAATSSGVRKSGSPAGSHSPSSPSSRTRRSSSSLRSGSPKPDDGGSSRAQTRQLLQRRFTRASAAPSPANTVPESSQGSPSRQSQSRLPTLRHAVFRESASHAHAAGGFSDNQLVMHSHMRLGTELSTRVKHSSSVSGSSSGSHGVHSVSSSSPSLHGLASPSPSLSLAAFKLASIGKPADSVSTQPIARERDRSNTIQPAVDLTLYRHSPIVLHLTHDSLVVWTFNWKPAIVDSLAAGLSRLLSWTCFRQQLLRNILHQKMGLFQHAPPVTQQLPCVSRNFLPVGQLAAQARGGGHDELSAATTPAALGRFTLNNIDLLIQHATPPIRGGQPNRGPLPSASISTPGVTTPSASSVPSTPIALSSGLANPNAAAAAAAASAGRAPPNASNMSAAEIAREKMARQRMAMYSKMRGGPPGAAFPGAPAHISRASNRGSGGAPSMASPMRDSDSRSSGMFVSIEPTVTTPSSRPAPVSVTSPLPPTTPSQTAAGANLMTPGGSNNDPNNRSRSGSLSAHATPMADTPSARSSSSTLTSPVVPVRKSSALAPIPQLPSATAPSAASLQSLNNLIYSRVRAFARILRGVAPPVGHLRSALDKPRGGASVRKRHRDPLQFHAAGLRKLVQLQSDFYARPIDTLNLCWHWLHATTLAVHQQQNPSPARPRLDAASLQFLKYLTQMARQVKQVRVPLFFNRIVAQWVQQRAEQHEDETATALPSAWPSLQSLSSSASSSDAAPPSSLLLHLSLLDSFLSEFVRFAEREHQFTLVAVVVGSDTAHSASEARISPSGSETSLPREGSTPTGLHRSGVGGSTENLQQTLKPKMRSKVGANSVVSALQTPAVPLTLLANLSVLLSPLEARIAGQPQDVPTLPLQPMPCAKVQLAPDAPPAALPPLRVLLRRVLHGYTLLLTVEFSGALVVTSLSMAPLLKAERTMSNSSGVRKSKPAPVATATTMVPPNMHNTQRLPSSAKKAKQSSQHSVRSSASHTPVGLSRVGSSANLDPQSTQTPVSNWPTMVAITAPGSAGLSQSTPGAMQHAAHPSTTPPGGSSHHSSHHARSSSHAASTPPPSFDSLSDLRVAANVYSHVLDLSRSLHLHSFLYDFHLRHFASYVLEPLLPYPPMDLLLQLHTFHSWYPNPPHHARNHLVRRDLVLTLPLDLADPSDFFRYLAINAQKYGLGSMAHRGQDHVVFLSSAMPGSGSAGAAGTSATAKSPPPSGQDDQPSQVRHSSAPRAIAAGSPGGSTFMPTAPGPTSHPPPAPSPSPAYVYLFVAFLASDAAAAVETVSASSSSSHLASASSPMGGVGSSSFDSSRGAGSSLDLTPSSSSVSVSQTPGGSASLSGGGASIPHAPEHHEVRLQYYMMRVDPSNRTPSVQAHPPSSLAAGASVSHSGGSASSRKNPSVAWEELLDMMVSQVAAGAEKTLQKLCAKSLPHYQRDLVWRRLVRGGTGVGMVSPAGSSSAAAAASAAAGSSMVVDIDVSELEFEVLRALTYRRPLSAIDAQLSQLYALGTFIPASAGALYSSLFTHLIKVYYGHVRQFKYKDHKHLLICNKHDRDCMIHIVVRLPVMAPGGGSNAAVRVTGESKRMAAASVAEMRAASVSAAPWGVPPSWLAGAFDTDSSGLTPLSSSPFQFVACRRVVTQLANPHEIDMITHLTNTITHFCWTYMTA